MNILFLCRREDMDFGRASLARALERKGVRVTCVADDTPVDEHIAKLVTCCDERPSLILQPESNFPLLPQGLTTIDIPTACLQIDTYAYTERRIRWSMLFDHPIVYHPGYQAQFERAGHPGVITLYHAACRDLFCKPPVDRTFDVGSVGRTHAYNQSTRRRVLAALSEKFRLNDWERFHGFEEMAEAYRHSKIVVNVTRDDFPQDANMRAFEAMAAGCLLITPVPTELTAIGFQENVHFVPYRHECEIMGLVSEYLCQNEKRERIATAGRVKVLAEHTYDNRAAELLRVFDINEGQLHAPARKWPEARMRRARIDYYSACMEIRPAMGELRQLAKRDLLEASFGALLITAALTRKPRARFRSLLHRGA
jgi:hypothetical protein